jgi:hypothetical protein
MGEARDFPDEELWNLDKTIGQFVAPRLRRFKEIKHLLPGGLQLSEDSAESPAGRKAIAAWDESLDKMIRAFELAAAGNTDGHREEVREGLEEFAKHFMDLWD